MRKAWRITPIFERTAKARTRYIFNEGGTRSSKTISNLQNAYKLLEANPDMGLKFSVVSESIPHLKLGAMHDFFEFLLKSHGIYNKKYHNKSDHTYSICGNTLEFFGTDSEAKVHGPARDFLYCNEIQNMKLGTFRHLEIRTKYAIYADWNPVGDFWIYDEYIDNPTLRDKITFIRSTYKDNPYLAQEQIDSILSIASRDENFRRVYVEGQRGRLEGLVFPNSEQVHFWPEHLDKRGFAIDPGFSNDPTAIIECGLYQGDLFIRCHSYVVGQTTDDVWRTLIKKGITSNIVIDPGGGGDRMGEELRRKGIQIEIAKKDKINSEGLRNTSIDLLRQYKLKLFCEGKDDPLWKERNNYIYKYDKREGRFTNEPVDRSNHCFVGETLITTDKRQTQIRNVKAGDMVLTSKGYRRVLHRWDNGIKKVKEYTIKTNQSEIKAICTPDHKIYTPTGFKEIQHINTSDYINILLNHEQVISVRVKSKGQRQVFDLMVYDQHEYFANGILVSNCFDAARYYGIKHLNRRTITNPWEATSW